MFYWFCHLLNSFLTPWNTILLQKLTGSQLLNKFPAFYGTQRFITAFTSAYHLSLSSVTSIRSMPLHPTSWRSILILSSHLSLGLPNGLFPSGFPTKSLYTTLLSAIRATCPARLILLDLITRTISGEDYRSLISSFCSFLHSPVTCWSCHTLLNSSTQYLITVTMKTCHHCYYPNTRANEQTQAHMRMCRTHRFLVVRLIFEVTPFLSFTTVALPAIPVTHSPRHYRQFNKEVSRHPSDNALQNYPLSNKAPSVLQASKFHILIKLTPMLVVCC